MKLERLCITPTSYLFNIKPLNNILDLKKYILLVSRNSVPQDGAESEGKAAEEPPELKMFIRDGSEAVLITKGDRGLLVCKFF